MPTGYTAPVQDGKITELRDYALSCARAFGACIHMRDDPSDIPAPREVPPRSTYHDEALQNAKIALANLEALTPQQIEARTDQDYTDRLSNWRQRRLERERHRENYERMLAEVEKWAPPSGDHVKFKEFMASQLRESIDFDCSNRHDEEPQPQTMAEWHNGAIDKAKWSVEYHTKELAAEIERHNGRNKWLADLYNSLPAQP